MHPDAEKNWIISTTKHIGTQTHSHINPVEFCHEMCRVEHFMCIGFVCNIIIIIMACVQFWQQLFLARNNEKHQKCKKNCFAIVLLTYLRVCFRVAAFSCLLLCATWIECVCFFFFHKCVCAMITSCTMRKIDFVLYANIFVLTNWMSISAHKHSVGLPCSLIYRVAQSAWL